ncbi:50S ribosomal protein L11 [Striga asiatica]|uniref:50S ribosomal protein L11 n=1 Tax=Striga asiatica TaxID=4170 RepID=A0A5A7PPB1_STRAF|nr:50S ribosomal protein L11 [Striga asiatica]
MRPKLILERHIPSFRIHGLFEPPQYLAVNLRLLQLVAAVDWRRLDGAPTPAAPIIFRHPLRIRKHSGEELNHASFSSLSNSKQRAVAVLRTVKFSSEDDEFICDYF